MTPGLVFQEVGDQPRDTSFLFHCTQNPIHQLPRGGWKKPAAIMCLKPRRARCVAAWEAWSKLQTQLRQLSALNKERALEAARVKK